MACGVMPDAAKANLFVSFAVAGTVAGDAVHRPTAIDAMHDARQVIDAVGKFAVGESCGPIRLYLSGGVVIYDGGVLTLRSDVLAIAAELIQFNPTGV